MTLDLTTSLEAGALWFRVHARVRPATLEEMGPASESADNRAVDFARREGGLPMLAWTEPYAPLEDMEVLGAFVQVFGTDKPPSDDQVEEFYRRFGAIRDAAWMEQLPDEERDRLPAPTRLRFREPLWFVRELATELRICADLYRGLSGGDLSIVREVLGNVPDSGGLADLRLMGGQLVKIPVGAKEAKRKVGSVGAWRPSPKDPGRPMTDEECTRWGRELVRRQLNQYEARAHRQWVHRTELPWDDFRADDPLLHKDENAVLGGFRTLTFDSLITALYVQLSDRAERGGLLRRCRECNRLFFPSRTNQYYCRPQCSNIYRHRRVPDGNGGEKAGSEEVRDAG